MMTRMLWLLLLICAALFGDERVLVFANIEAPQSMLEAATLIRSIGEIRELRVDVASKQMFVSGTPEQIAMTEWLFKELDRTSFVVGVKEYPIADSKIAVFTLAQEVKSVKELQEAAVVVRATADIRRLFTYNGGGVIAVRGTDEQIALSAWLLKGMGYGITAQPVAEFSFDGGVVRMLGVRNARRDESLQEMAVAARSLGEIRWVMIASARHAIVIRGSQEQVAMGAWLVSTLDALKVDSAYSEYPRTGATGNDVVRVFFLKNAGEASAAVQQVKAAAKVWRLASYGELNAIAARGTRDEIAAASKLLASVN